MIPEERRGGAKPWILGLTAACLGVLLYSGSWNGGFVWDDHLQIEQGKLISDPENLGTLFRTDVWANVYPNTTRRAQKANIYRPLQNASFMASYHFFGLDPGPWHVENSVVHGLCVLALFFLLFRFHGRRDEAFLGALFFAMLPIQSEAVAWIAGRSDLWIGLLMLGAFHCYLSARARQGAMGWWIGCGLLQFAALLFKEPAVVLPAWLLLYEWLLAEKETPWGKRLLGIATLGIPIGAYFTLRATVLGGMQAGTEGLPIVRFLTEGIPVVAHFLHWSLLSSVLTIVRPWVSPSWPAILVLNLAGIAFIGVLVWRVRRANRSPLPLWGLLVFGASLAPTAMLAVLTGGVAERYAYVALVGLAPALAHPATSFLRWFSHIGKRRLAISLLTTIFALLMLRTATRVEDWDHDLALYHAAIDDQPENPDALYRAGTWLAQTGEREASRKLLFKAIELAPKRMEFANNAGVLLIRHGRYKEAEALFEKALKTHKNDEKLHYNLALSRVFLGDLGAARNSLDQALRLNPHYENARALQHQIARNPNRRLRHHGVGEFNP